MAPHGESLVSALDNKKRSSSASNNNNKKPPRLTLNSLHRTVSDVSFELMTKESLLDDTTIKEITTKQNQQQLAPILEVENAKCECCGMSEECTPEYINRVRSKFFGKLICGLCGEAVKEEVEKNGGKNEEEALNNHMSACAKFNKFGRSYPVLYQAEAMREMYRKSTSVRAKSISPRDKAAGAKKGGIARSSSCIPAITRDMNGLIMTD